MMSEYAIYEDNQKIRGNVIKKRTNLRIEMVECLQSQRKPDGSKIGSLLDKRTKNLYPTGCRGSPCHHVRSQPALENMYTQTNKPGRFNGTSAQSELWVDQ